MIIARELLGGALAAASRGSDCLGMCTEIDLAWATASDAIRNSALPLGSDAELLAVAGNAARDPAIGELVSQALDRVGEDGVINIEDDRRYGIQLDFVDGMSFPSGLLAHGLATDETKRQSVFEQPLILTASERIHRSGSWRQC